MNTEERKSFLEELSKRKKDSGLSSFFSYYLDEHQMQSPTLFQLMGTEESELSETGKKVLRFLESENVSNDFFNFETFKWKIHAFLSVQEVLFIPVYTDTTAENLFQLRYFYYESKYVLSESIHASLNGLHIGNSNLLRVFIEFNLLQIYYIKKGDKEQSHRSFHNYLKSSIKPGNNELLKFAIPDNNFCKPIKKRIQWELQRLSNNTSHAYTHLSSPKAMGIAIPQTSIDSIYFYIQISAVLDAVLWMYYVNFPLIFFPVDVIRKFGFNEPWGIFATHSTAWIVKKSMPEKDYIIFKDHFQESEFVKGNHEWYNSLTDLTDAQIWETADERRELKDTFISYYAKKTSSLRAYSEMAVEAMRRGITQTNDQKIENIDPNKVIQYLSFHKWRDIYGTI